LEAIIARRLSRPFDAAASRGEAAALRVRREGNA
jgi:hypothetical protein